MCHKPNANFGVLRRTNTWLPVCCDSFSYSFRCVRSPKWWSEITSVWSLHLRATHLQLRRFNLESIYSHKNNCCKGCRQLREKIHLTGVCCLGFDSTQLFFSYFCRPFRILLFIVHCISPIAQNSYLYSDTQSHKAKEMNCMLCIAVLSYMCGNRYIGTEFTWHARDGERKKFANKSFIRQYDGAAAAALNMTFFQFVSHRTPRT